MIGDKAAIAVVGPTGEVAQGLAEKADSLARTLAFQRYAVIVLGSGPVAASAARGATQVGGACMAVGWNGLAPLSVPGIQHASGASWLSALERALFLAEAAVVLPDADLTSLALVSAVWRLALTETAPFKQLVLVGSEWASRVATLGELLGLERRQLAAFTFADTVDEAVETLRYYTQSA